MPRNLLIWCSPKDSPSSRWMESGQGLITRTVIDCSDIPTTVISPSARTYFFAIISLFIYVLSHSPESFSIYVVSSRTIPGFFRDFPAFIPILFKRRVHAHVHGADLHKLFAIPLLGFFIFKIYSKLSSTIFPSEIALPLNNLQLKNSIIIENCLPLPIRLDSKDNYIANDYGRCDIKNPTVNILWNSNLMASKGVVELVKGFDILTQRVNPFNPILTLLGKNIGDYELSAPALEAILAPYHRKHQFNFVGKVDATSSHLWLLRSDIIVLNTRYRTECQPLAVIAAMCEGKCIVASRHLSIKYTLRDYPCIWIDDSSNPYSVFDSLSRACAICHDKSYQETLTRHADFARQRFSASRFIRDLRAHLDI